MLGPQQAREVEDKQRADWWGAIDQRIQQWFHYYPVHYRAVPTMSDGTPGAPLNLRPLFEAYQVETS
jgi:hypothetical protein